jgi:hypothetical protein
MNGIGLLVLIAAAGQLSAAGPMTQNRDFGWEIDTRSEDRALCYIVQLSPQKVKEMQDTGWEYPSDMPPELIGRATRIVFRIGTNLLPQTPSLEEIKKIPRVSTPADVSAQLGPGRISDVETGSLYNVQQDQRAPALPSFGGGTSPAPLDPATNLADQAQQSANALTDNLRNFVRGTDPRLGTGATGPSPAGTAAAAPPMPGFPGTNAPSRFETPTSPLSTPDSRGLPTDGTGSWQASTAPAGFDPRTLNDPRLLNDRTRQGGTDIPDNRFSSATSPFPSGANAGQSPNYGAGTYSSTAAYDPRDPAALGREMFNGIPSRQTPTGGFGNYGTNNPSNFASTNPVQTGMPQAGAGQLGGNAAPIDYSGGQNPAFNQPPNNQFPNNPNSQFANSQFPNSQFANGAGFNADGTARIASSVIPPTGLPNTGAPAANPAANAAAGSTPTTPQGTPNANGSTDIGSRKTATADNILPVFFLLSLVVNVYLGMLIRKLLTRYRALLANRGQSTSGAYS